MKKRKTLEVKCQCGLTVAKYKKGGKGRLVKMFLERITEDPEKIFITDPPLKLYTEVICPHCEKRLATIRVIRGKYSAKLNQGVIIY